MERDEDDIVTIMPEDVDKIPPMTPQELKALENWVDTDFSDCPEITDEQIKWLEEHEEEEEELKRHF